MCTSESHYWNLRAIRGSSPNGSDSGGFHRLTQRLPSRSGDAAQGAGHETGTECRIHGVAVATFFCVASIELFHTNMRTDSTSSAVIPGFAIFVLGSIFFGSVIQSFAHA